jgi:hypothetical protein
MENGLDAPLRALKLWEGIHEPMNTASLLEVEKARIQILLQCLQKEALPIFYSYPTETHAELLTIGTVGFKQTNKKLLLFYIINFPGDLSKGSWK